MNEQLMDRLVRECDAIFHLASAVGVKLVMERPVWTIETIFKGTDIVLNLASRYRKRVLLTSTSEVYGKSTTIPFAETDDCTMGATQKRRWAYACAKALDEFLALAHYYQTNLPVKIVRLFNTVGPRQTGQYGMVMPTFISQALEGKEIRVYGTGKQRRCFCDVADIVKALMKTMDNPLCNGQVINIGSTEEISIMDLARRVKRLVKSRSQIVLIPYEEAYGSGFDDMDRRVPDIMRARKLIGFRPTVKLDSTIKRIAASLRDGVDH
jgi:UDP-glucose 4-epimerase